MSKEKQAVHQVVHDSEETPVAELDIEHALVHDDPRKWSTARKLSVVATISAASVINGLGANIYNRDALRYCSPSNTAAIAQIQEQLHASSGEISLSLSLFIGIQGTGPLVWSVFSESWGRKTVYLASTLLCTLGSIVAALAKSIGVLIGMRCIQAFGASAVGALGAATLADIYEPTERGTMVGIYYSAPLLGPALGPILGGVLTQAFNWRATFWFLAAFVGATLLLFVPFKDTFRRERSLVYQNALKRRVVEQPTKPFEAQTANMSSAASSAERGQVERSDAIQAQQEDAVNMHGRLERDIEKQAARTQNVNVPQSDSSQLKEIRLSLADVNPLKPIYHVLRRMNNLVLVFSSGFVFGFYYSIAYTCALTLANGYHYDALRIGLVLLAFGIGSLCGSVLGGRYSDHVFRKLKARNDGKGRAEMRLESTFVPMGLLPPCVIAYGWVCERHASVAAICVLLFLSGFFSICIHSCTLSYVVDANPGRSSSAVATNSAFRGLAALVASEVAVPLQVFMYVGSQSAVGDGGMYSLWGGLLVFAEVLILVVWWKGGAWREKWERKEQGSHSGP
ncbi:MFS general substrate transporter [Trametes elegans]|nr:MFS general substrate transporter [Trametes elegans]